MNKLKKHHIVKLYCLLVTLFFLLTSFPAIANSVDAMLAWGDQDSAGVYHIYFSQKKHNNWSDPILISASGNPETLPAIGSNDQGDIWLAWTELHGGEAHILWSYHTDGSWSTPVMLVTPTESDMAPSIAVDAWGTAWMAYSGRANRTDDIYVVHWNGSTWTMPIKINLDDKWPDIQPVIDLDPSGLPVVFWRGYNGDGYVQYQSHWDGASWSPEKQSGQVKKEVAGGKTSLPASRLEQDLQELPSFLTDRSQAVFHYTSGDRKTIRLRAY